jgi:hypothetical protein
MDDVSFLRASGCEEAVGRELDDVERTVAEDGQRSHVAVRRVEIDESAHLVGATGPADEACGFARR